MNITKKFVSFMLALSLIASSLVFSVSAANTGDVSVSKTWDNQTVQNISSEVSTANNGRVWNDKSVSGDSLELTDSNGNKISSDLLNVDAASDDYLVALSTLSQKYITLSKTETEYKQANIAFVIDVSSSMTTNYMVNANGKTVSRLSILQTVAKEFATTLAGLGDNGFNINLSVITYSGSATTVLDWTSVTGSSLSKVNNIFTSYLSNKYNEGGDNTNAEAGLALANYMFDKSTVAGDKKCTSTPSNVNDEHTSNYILYMSDGGPNRYYTSSNYGFKSLTKNGATFNYATSNSGISETINGTDYKTLAAQHPLERISESTKINNMTVYSLGLGEWFTTDASQSGFSTAPYLLQLIAAVGNKAITVDEAVKYLGTNIPYYAMPGNNPGYPTFNTASFKNGTRYYFQKLNKYYNTEAELLEALENYFGDYETRAKQGINYVDTSVIHKVRNYYAGNTAAKFEQSVVDIVTSIKTNLNNSIIETETANQSSCYVSFTDKLGEYMTVDEFRCIYYNGELYTGASFAEKFAPDNYDFTDADYKAFRNSFTKMIRANYLTDEALEKLMQGCIAAGDLYYKNDSDYSNKIKWYAAYDETDDSYYYIGNYYDENGNVNPAPADAEYVFESWYCFGSIGGEIVVTGEEQNLVGIGAGVATNLKTGEQTVKYDVPSELLPVGYVSTSNNIAHVVTSVLPASLIFTVKPDDNAVIAGDYKYLDEKNNLCTYYTNNWDASSDSSDENTYVTYTPESRNTYFYLQEDSVLYVLNADGTYSEAAESDSSNQLFYKESYCDENGLVENYYPLNEYFENAKTTTVDGKILVVHGAWLKHSAARSSTVKSTDVTGTMDYVRLSTYTVDGTPTTFDVKSFLGNNGKLVKSVTALTITKVWADGNNKYGTRPDSIDMTVLKDGKEYKDITINESDCVVSKNEAGNDTWTYTVNTLPYGSAYSVSEADVPFYKDATVTSVSDTSVTVTNTVDTWFTKSASVVLDFGLPTDIDYFAKVNMIDYKNLEGMTISVDSSNLKYGTAEVVDGMNVRYTPTTANWDGYDTINVTMSFNGADVVGTLIVAPAMNVYYEENFVDYDEHWVDTGVAAESYQQNDNILYGFDLTYSENHDVLDSNGNAKCVTVTKDNYMYDSTFSFTGTGFDLISRTCKDSGTIFVQVKNSANKVLKTYIVDTSLMTDDFYQIPVIHCSDLAYGKYTVLIKGYYNIIFDHNIKTELEGSYKAYVDGIRVYNPLGADRTKYDSAVTDLYTESNEIQSTTSQIRTALISADKWNSASGAEDNITDGIVYIADGTTAGKTDTWESSGIYLSNSGNTYESKGPKNEVYLTNGHGVAFGINEHSMIQISVKSPTGKAVGILVYNVIEKKWFRAAVITTPTEMFYDITPYVADGYAIIKCESDDPTAILSLCQLKMSIIEIDSEHIVETSAAVSANLIKAAYSAYGSADIVDACHVCKYESSVVKAATCEEDGVLRYTCPCGESYDEVIPAPGHNFVGGTCTECSKKASAHTHMYSFEVVKDATCTEEGVIKYFCSCGDSYELKIEKTAHTYDANGVCVDCGAKQQETPAEVVPETTTETVPETTTENKTETTTENTTTETEITENNNSSVGSKFIEAIKSFFAAIKEFFANLSSIFNF